MNSHRAEQPREQLNSRQWHGYFSASAPMLPRQPHKAGRIAPYILLAAHLRQLKISCKQGSCRSCRCECHSSGEGNCVTVSNSMSLVASCHLDSLRAAMPAKVTPHSAARCPLACHHWNNQLQAWNQPGCAPSHSSSVLSPRMAILPVWRHLVALPEGVERLWVLILHISVP